MHRDQRESRKSIEQVLGSLFTITGRHGCACSLVRHIASWLSLHTLCFTMDTPPASPTFSVITYTSSMAEGQYVLTWPYPSLTTGLS